VALLGCQSTVNNSVSERGGVNEGGPKEGMSCYFLPTPPGPLIGRRTTLHRSFVKSVAMPLRSSPLALCVRCS
jgi:hypothetical protein